MSSLKSGLTHTAVWDGRGREGFTLVEIVVVVLIIGLALVAAIAPGCSGKRVSRVAVDETIDLSGRWNDTDSRLVSEEMVSEALSRPWVDKFLKKHGTEPTVIVGTVVNRSHEHINTQTFTKDLERELTNSGRVQFVASKGERDEVRELFEAGRAKDGGGYVFEQPMLVNLYRGA